MSTKAKEKPRAHITLVFLGVRISRDDKLHQVFRKLLVNGNLEEEPRWYSGIKNVGRPGGVFCMACNADNDSTVYSSTARYLRMWEDDEEIVAWQAAHDAATATDRARRRFKKETGINRVFECLDPVRAAYARAKGLQRQVILAQAVSYITRSK